MRELTGEEAQRFEPARGGAGGQNVAISHTMLHEGPDLEPRPETLVPKIPAKSNLSGQTRDKVGRISVRPESSAGAW